MPEIMTTPTSSHITTGECPGAPERIVRSEREVRTPPHAQRELDFSNDGDLLASPPHIIRVTGNVSGNGITGARRSLF